MIGSALTTLPASLAMGRWGRRKGFMLGAAMGVIGTAIGVLALSLGSFALLCLATFVVGSYNAIAQYFRFAAADVAEAYAPELKERAIAWVLAAGLAGGIIGPELSKLTRTALPTQFAGTYVTLATNAESSANTASVTYVPANSIGSAARVSLLSSGPTMPPASPAASTQAIARSLSSGA